jgi:hypothetical protein
VSVEGCAGRPPERAGSAGGSDGVLEDGESAGLSIPSPALRFALAVFVDDVRSGWLRVGVVGDGLGLSFREMGADGFRAEDLSESPRAGRSTTRLDPNDDSEVCGESCEPSGGEDVNVGSISGRLSRADMVSFLEEVGNCIRSWGCGDGVSSESLRLASAFLFFGTSCSLKGSAAEGAGEAC